MLLPDYLKIQRALDSHHSTRHRQHHQIEHRLEAVTWEPMSMGPHGPDTYASYAVNSSQIIREQRSSSNFDHRRISSPSLILRSMDEILAIFQRYFVGKVSHQSPVEGIMVQVLPISPCYPRTGWQVQYRGLR